jgi:ribosomal protein S18 acetylase RimI-like enzyme
MYTGLAAGKGRSERNRQQSESPDSEEHEEILFRRFRSDEDDEQQMRELVFSNAFLGEPFDVICPCKQWFGDVVLAPYLKYQSENILVAVHKPSGRLIGYLTGSMGGQEFEEKQYNLVKKQVASLAVSLSMPWNIFDHSSRLFIAHVIFKGERERPNHPQSGVHWHFQVDKEFRSRGIGTALLQRFVREAIAADFELIWAEVTSYPEKPLKYFEDRGWSIYDARATGIFGNKVDFPVQTLCITRLLSSFKNEHDLLPLPA